MMNPVISIIVPVYNVELYLGKCIESILAQTFTDFEVILVNDGSTDSSGDICDEFAKRDERVKVVHKENGGLSSARNAGIERALGAYIGLVDGDDWIDRNMYKELFYLCKQTESDISICKLGREVNGVIVNAGTTEFTKEMNNIEALRELFKAELFRFSACNKLFKKSLFLNIKFPEGRIHEDLSTTYRLFANSKKAVFTNNIGYIYVKRENSILTSKYNEKRLDAFIGWNELLTFMKATYPDLTNEVLSCFAYGCVDHVHYILNQVENNDDRNKYLRRIQALVRKHFKDIMKINILSFRHKYIFALLNYNFHLLLYSNALKKMIRS